MKKSSFLILLSLYFILLLLSCQKEKSDTDKPSEATSTSKIYYDLSDDSLTFKIDTFFSNRFRQRRFNGVALFAKDGKIIYHKAYGLSNFKTKDSLDVNDAFQLASVSKTITAVAVLQLVEKELISLDDTLQQYFPKFPYQGITIRNLLSHQSGLPNYMYFVDKVFEAKDSSISNDFMLTIMQRDTPKVYFSPNQRYHYCNTNYALLAILIEKVTDIKYEDYLQKEIFNPARMDSSFVYNKNTQPKLPQEVIGYNAIYRQKENHYQNGVIGDKGIYASAVDLFKFDRALQDGILVSKKLLEEAYQPHDARLKRLNKDNYGLGWRIQHKPNFGKVVYHGGWWKGFKTYFIRQIDKNNTIIVLTNVTRGGYLNTIELQKLLE